MIKYKLNILTLLLLILFGLLSCNGNNIHTVDLTPSEEQWLKDNISHITVAPCPDYPPIDFIDEDGEYSGLSADYIRYIEKMLNVEFNIVHREDWATILKEAREGSIDVVLSIQNTPERRQYLLFTEPYVHVPNVIVACKDSRDIVDLRSLEDRKVSVVKEFAVTQYISEHYPRVQLRRVVNERKALADVFTHQSEAAIISIPAASYYIKEKTFPHLQVVGTMGYDWYLCFGINKDHQMLWQIMNKTLRQMPDNEKRKIIQRWVKLLPRPFYQKRAFWIWSLAIFLFLLLCVALLILLNRRLIQKIAKQTEHIQRVQRLESLGVLAGGIAHDFNNILAVILGNTDLLRIELQSVDVKHPALMELVNNIESGCHNAKSLTHQLLTFARGGEPVKKSCDIRKIVRDSVDFSTKGSSVKLDYDLPSYQVNVYGDPGMLSQAFQNITINAVQAMPGGGCLHVSLKETNDARAAIRFADTGIGIDESMKNTIFDPYVTTKENGTGLGLSSSHSIISKHNGSISVSSAIGKGSTFTVYLPLDNSTGDETLTPLKKWGKVPFSYNVIIMDDEKPVRDVLQAMLETLGCTVTAAANGEQLLEEFQEQRASGNTIDCVFLDLTIKGGSGGIATLKQLKKIDPKVKSVVISGYAENGVLSDYRSFGFTGMVRKPFVMDDIFAVLDEIL